MLNQLLLKISALIKKTDNQTKLLVNKTVVCDWDQKILTWIRRLK